VIVSADAHGQRRNADDKPLMKNSAIFRSQILSSLPKNTWHLDRFLDIVGDLSATNPRAFVEMVPRRASSFTIRDPDIAYLLNVSSAGRNNEPVWKSIDPSQVNFSSILLLATNGGAD